MDIIWVSSCCYCIVRPHLAEKFCETLTSNFECLSEAAKIEIKSIIDCAIKEHEEWTGGSLCKPLSHTFSLWKETQKFISEAEEPK